MISERSPYPLERTPREEKNRGEKIKRCSFLKKVITASKNLIIVGGLFVLFLIALFVLVMIAQKEAIHSSLEDAQERRHSPNPERISEETLKEKCERIGNFFIVVDKERKVLYVAKILNQYDCGVGLPGPKKVPGDRRTPEGFHKIVNIQPSNHWVDPLTRRFLYGPFFIRLEHLYSPRFRGIGIHGVGERKARSVKDIESRGCIVVSNQDITDLVDFINNNGGLKNFIVYIASSTSGGGR